MLVVNQDDVVEQRLVQIGALNDGMRVIQQGLSADDRVVVDGLQRAIPGSKVAPAEVAEPPTRRRRRLDHAAERAPEARPRAGRRASAAGRERLEPSQAGMFSKFFIERPVLANVIALLMILIGAVALFELPVAQYPPITPPTVQVTTRYPGASAQVLVDTVALPIEEQVNGVENMLYMQSTSTSDGTYTLTVTFEIGTDPDFAQVLVQNRVAIAHAVAAAARCSSRA